jgi:hypothetical protein
MNLFCKVQSIKILLNLLNNKDLNNYFGVYVFAQVSYHIDFGKSKMLNPPTNGLINFNTYEWYFQYRDIESHWGFSLHLGITHNREYFQRAFNEAEEFVFTYRAGHTGFLYKAGFSYHAFARPVLLNPFARFDGGMVQSAHVVRLSERPSPHGLLSFNGEELDESSNALNGNLSAGFDLSLSGFFGKNKAFRKMTPYERYKSQDIFVNLSLRLQVTWSYFHKFRFLDVYDLTADNQVKADFFDKATGGYYGINVGSRNMMSPRFLTFSLGVFFRFD